MAGNDLLLVAGGLGMAPLRSLLWYALDNRDEFRNVTLMYGAKSPAQMLFREELASLVDRDRPASACSPWTATRSGTWKYHVGLLPKLFDHAESTRPPPTPPCAALRWSTSSCCKRLLELGFSKDRILMSLERRMKCGVGKCAHCSVGYKLHLHPRPDLHVLGRNQPAGDDLMAKPTLGVFGLTGCAGDQLVILNCEDQLLRLTELVDIKDFLMASSGNDTACQLDVALVDGAVLSKRDENTLKQIRERSGILVALGTCAVWGGVAAMDGNGDRAQLAVRRLRRHGPRQYDTLPARALHEVVKVDLNITGCPIEKSQLLAAVANLLQGDPPLFPKYPVCTECRIEGEQLPPDRAGQGLLRPADPGRVRRAVVPA